MLCPRLPAVIHPLTYSIRRCLVPVVSTAAATLAPLALAQSEPSSGAEPLVLDEIRVQGEALTNVTEGSEAYKAKRANTALRLELTPRETPQSVSVITRAQMEDFSLNSINDVLESSPGISVERVETDRTYYTARGFDITNFQVDGLGAPFAYDNVQGDIDTAIYDRVEVLRGANGLMSGAGNPSATINFIRKRPTREAQAAVSGSAGSWNHKRLDIDVSGPFDASGKVRGRFVAAGEDTDSYLDRYHRDRRVLYGVIEADVTDSTILAAGHSWQENNTDSPLWGALPLFYTDGSATDYDVSTSTASEWSYWDTTDNRSFIELTHFFANDWQGRAALNYVNTDADTKLFYIYGTPERDSGEGLFSFPSLYEFNNEQWIADVYANGPFELAGRQHELVVGANWTRSRTKDVSHYGEDIGTPLPPLEEWDGRYPEPDFTGGEAGSDFIDKQVSLYSAARLSLTDRLTAVAGARLTQLDNEGESYGQTRETSYDNVLTPYTGLVYDVNDQVTLYASYTEIFQPQTEVDINRDRLDPIDGINYEAGVKTQWFDQRVDASLAVFRTEQNNLAEPAGTIPGSVDTYYEGVDGIRSEGFEATLAGEIAPSWHASIGYTYVDIEDADGERARPFTPRQMVRATTSYRPAFMDKLKVGARVRWQDAISRDQVNDITSRQDAYALVDLMARYDINENLSASLNLNNVTDEKYLTSLYWAQGFYGAPRHAMFKLSWHY